MILERNIAKEDENMRANIINFIFELLVAHKIIIPQKRPSIFNVKSN